MERHEGAMHKAGKVPWAGEAWGNTEPVKYRSKGLRQPRAA